MSGLVGWWPLHNTEGDTMYDLSGNGNHGSNNGAIQGVAGRAGLTSCSFDGDSDYVAVSKSPELEFREGENITVSSWFRTTSSTSGDLVSTYRVETTDGYTGWFLRVTDDGRVTFDGRDESGYISTSSRSGFNDGVWHHAVGQRKEDIWKVFVDGELVDTNDIGSSGNINGTDPLTIGRRGDGGTYHEGNIGDVRVYNRALSPSEVKELYRMGSRDLHKKSLSDGSDRGAISRWKLEDGGSDGSTAIDTWNNNDGTINGASFTENSVRNDERALQFDGSDEVLVENPDLPFGGSSRTVMAWIYPQDISSERNFIASYGGDPDNSGDLFNFEINSWRNGEGHFGFHGYFIGYETVERHLEEDSWYFIAVTYPENGAARDMTLYLNGYEVLGEYTGDDDEEDTQLNTQESDLMIGERDDNSGPFTGIVDDVRVFDRALSSWEVFELYRWGSLGIDMRKELVNKKGKGGGQ